jgi:hypothetical protein
MLTEALRRLAARPDFRRNPVKAVAKRAAWRLRWLATSQPVSLRLDGGFSIVAPKGAVRALVYYLGSSEPESARFIESLLQPGMVSSMWARTSANIRSSVRAARPDLRMPAGNYSRFGHSTEEVIGFLNSFGYRVQPMETGYTARKGS